MALAGCYARISRAGTFEIHSVWETEDIAENIADAAVLSRSYGFADFGPLKVLRATSVRGQDSEAEAEALEVMAAGVTAATSQNALDLGANPLLIAGHGAGADAAFRRAWRNWKACNFAALPSAFAATPRFASAHA